MSRRLRRSLALAISLLALVLGGCGGGEDQSASNASSARQQTAAAKKQAAEEDEQKRSSIQDKAEAQRSKPRRDQTTVTPPPISSAPVKGSEQPAPGVKTVKGGDNSVQTYGVESGEAERTEAAIALQGYLDARLEEDWGSACSYLAQRPKEQLEKLVTSAKAQGEDIAGCAGVMTALGAGTRQDATISEVLSFRGGGDVPGDPFYLIFLAPPGSTLYSMPMYLEGGQWKVGLAMPSELPV